MPIEKSAGAIIFHKEKGRTKYLLIQYASGHWEFPRGGIEKGEKLEETAKREIEEETGIKDVEFIEGFKEWIKFYFRRDNKVVMKIATFLLTETKKKEVKLSFEHKDYVWLDFEKAVNKLTYNNSKKVLTKANEFLKKSDTIN